MRISESLLLALCAATAAVLGEAIVLGSFEGHYLIEFRRDLQAVEVWGHYAVLFGGIGIAHAALRFALPRGRRPAASALLLASVLTVPIVLAPVALRLYAFAHWVVGPAEKLLLGAIALTALWLLWVAARGGARSLTATLTVLLTLVFGFPAFGAFASHNLISVTLSLQGAGVALCTGGVGLALARPLARRLATQDATRLLAVQAAGLATAFAMLLLSAPLWRDALPERVAASSGAAKPPPSILLLVCDTLRIDHAFDRVLAPNVAALARDGIAYERAYSGAPWTAPAFASILTSTYPSVHRTGDFTGSDTHKLPLRDDIPTLGEALNRAGYSTLATLSNPTLSPRYGMVRGFDQYENILPPRSYHPLDSFVARFDAFDWMFDEAGFYVPAEAQTARILEAVDRGVQSGRPFFLLAHYMDPHLPWNAPESFTGRRRTTSDERSDRFDAYRDEVHYMDFWLGELMAELRRRGLYDDLLVIFTADHGEELAENRQEVFMDGHGYTLNEEAIHVPLVLKLPGNSRAGERQGRSVTTVDLAPTILGLAGVDAPDSFVGRDLLRIDANDELVLAEGVKQAPKQRAAIRGHHKVIAHRLPLHARAISLFDLERDPSELYPLRGTGQPEFRDLIEALSRPSSDPSEVESKGVEVDPALERQLEALGYTH